MPDHDVLAFAAGLSTKLATRSRHITLFMGAGTSKACGLPDVATLQQRIVERLEGDALAAFQSQLQGRNLEQVLSRIRRIATVASESDVVDGLTKTAATELDAAICSLIVDQLSVAPASLAPNINLASWVSRAEYSRPVEIFTVNYDLLVETALERAAVPYFDGFVGVSRGRFRVDLVEDPAGVLDAQIPPFFARVWKLHGSINWAWSNGEAREVVRLGTPALRDATAAIYPSDAKYEESRRVPFLVLHDRLRRALQEPESQTLVMGYAWGDEHIDELIFDVCARRPRSEVVALCFDEIPTKLAEVALRTPNLQVTSPTEAILGGIRANWKDPNGGTPVDVWKKGRFQMGDFACAASYLARIAANDSNALADQLAVALATAGDAK